MAHSATASHPWEPDYDEKWKSSLIENETLLNPLIENMPVIVRSVALSEKFWSLLLLRGVVDPGTKTRIQGYNQKHTQATSLIQHVMSVEVYKFHGFIWALVNSSQCHLAELFGFSVQDYLDVEVYFMSSAFKCPACHEFYTKAYILTGCGHYVCAPCVKGAQFICKDNKKEDVTCPVPECGKITEASPCDGNIGLEEDGDFSDLCEAMLKEVKKESAQTTEGKSTAENEDEEEKSNAGSEEKEGMSTDSEEEEEEEVNLSQCLQEGISDLEVKMSCLQKYKDVLGKYEPGVKDHIVRAVEKAKQNVDDWAKETLGLYSSVCQQVEKNLQKSVKWKTAASELSVLVAERPGFLEGCLKDKINLPKETMTDAGEKLITKLDAGCPIPPLFPYKFCFPIPLTKAKFCMNLEGKLRQDSACSKVAWMPDGCLMFVADTVVCRLALNTAKAECEPTWMQEARQAFDMSVAADGTWILSLWKNGVIEIHYPGVEEVKRWRPEGIIEPGRVFINNNNIFVREFDSQVIRSYSRDLVFVDQYDVGTKGKFGFIHVTERGILMESSDTESRIYIIDLETKETSSFGSQDKRDGGLSKPRGLCTVNNDEYILVCDRDTSHVSVFTHDGQFINHLDVEGGIQSPYTIAVLAQRGKPSLMALDGVINGKHTVCVYSLE